MRDCQRGPMTAPRSHDDLTTASGQLPRPLAAAESTTTVWAMRYAGPTQVVTWMLAHGW